MSAENFLNGQRTQELWIKIKNALNGKQDVLEPDKTIVMQNGGIGVALPTLGGELVKPANPVGAALSSKAALSTQQTVEKTAISGREVTVAAVELQTYINALPRLRTESLIINVAAGTVPGTLKLEGFYGPGYLTISGPGAESGGVLGNGVEVLYCSNPINIIGFDVRGTSAGSAVNVGFSVNVYLGNLTADGNNFVQGSEHSGLDVSASTVSAQECTFSNMKMAVYCVGSIAHLTACGGSGNQLGNVVEYGGLILLCQSTPELMGGAANGKWGGAILGKNGVLL